MQRHGWTLLFHEGVIEQLRKLQAAAERAEQNDPHGFEGNANVKLFRALSQLIMEVVPSDPSRDEYRQGNTLGPADRHWRRAKIGRRFRLFFRYHSAVIDEPRFASRAEAADVPAHHPAARPMKTARWDDIGLLCRYSIGENTDLWPELGTNSIYRAFRPTMTASVGRLSRRMADRRLHSDLSRSDGLGLSSGWVCHSPK